MAHRPYGSVQDRMYPPALCCAGGLPPGFLCQRSWSFNAGPLEQGKGEKLAPQVLDRLHLEARHDSSTYRYVFPYSSFSGLVARARMYF